MDSNQEKLILALRPIISQAIVNDKSSENETFQNQSLRPIIKLSNDTILITIKSYLIQFNKTFENLTIEKKTTAIIAFLEKNQKIRLVLLGMTLGLMTSSELEVYFQNQSEYNKRIIQMIEQRAIDHIDFF